MVGDTLLHPGLERVLGSNERFLVSANRSEGVSGKLPDTKRVRVISAGR